MVELCGGHVAVAGLGFESSEDGAEGGGGGGGCGLLVELVGKPVAEGGGGEGVDGAEVGGAGDAGAGFAVGGEEGGGIAGVLEEVLGLVGFGGGFDIGVWHDLWLGVYTWVGLDRGCRLGEVDEKRPKIKFV